MSKQTTRSTKKSLGLISDREMELWNSDIKQRPRDFKSRQAPILKESHIENQEDFSIVFESSMNQLREKTKTERSTSSTLSNRMKYMEIDLQRKRQMAQLAKNKYQRMMEVRHKSFLEKKELTKERQIQNKRHLMSVTRQASRIKVERKNSAVNSQIWKEQNQEAASYIKEKRHQNESFIAQRTQIEVEKKKRLVEKQQHLSDLSKEKLRRISHERLQEGRNNHKKQMLQQYAKGEIQRRKNVNLIGVFTEKVRKIGESANKYQLQLQQYQRMLGIRGSYRKSPPKSSFYVTH